MAILKCHSFFGKAFDVNQKNEAVSSTLLNVYSALCLLKRKHYKLK
jgi:hypothetical protein